MKTKFFISAVLFLLIIISAPLRAGVLSELKYVSENSDIYTYANAEDFFLFAGKSGTTVLILVGLSSVTANLRLLNTASLRSFLNASTALKSFSADLFFLRETNFRLYLS